MLRVISAWLTASSSNWDYDSQFNGEQWLLQTMSRFDVKTVWDVGANVGTWSLAASKWLPKAEIHAFEINPAAFGILQQNTSGIKNYRANAFGLSSRNENADLYCFEGDLGLSSMFEYPHGHFRSKKMCKVITGDCYAGEHGVDYIDLVKIDVEGAEHLVLRGLERMLATSRIGLVQFEYGRVNILTHFLLSDFYRVFERYGYMVGKLYPGYVDFKAYSFEQEDFLGPNFVACKVDNHQHIAALTMRGRSGFRQGLETKQS